MNLRGAWPEFFGRPSQEDGQDGDPGLMTSEDGEIAFPSTDADMSEFEWEDVTPDSYRSDMDRLLALNQHVAVSDDPDTPAKASPAAEQDLEWT